MNRELSLGTGVTPFRDGLEGRDDAVEAGLDVAEVGSQAEVSAVVGPGDEDSVGVGLFTVHVEELGRGLEVGAGEARVGVRALLLGRSPAVTVGEAVADARKVVLDPLGSGGRALGVEWEELAVGVDPLLLIVIEGVSDSVVVDM